MPKVAFALVVMLILSEVWACPSFASSLEWPPTKRGIWELKANRKLVGGKAQSWSRTTRQCIDPSLMFRGYWGLGSVDKAGCQFESQKLPNGGFKITSKCPMRHNGISTSEALVTLRGDSEFEMQVNVTEGKKQYVGDEAGRRVKDCDDARGD